MLSHDGLAMKINISDSKQEMGRRAAAHGAELIRAAQKRDPDVAMILATGASQFEMLGELVRAPDIAWNHVTVFHLDEYVGMSIAHPASFRKYLWERFHS